MGCGQEDCEAKRRPSHDSRLYYPSIHSQPLDAINVMAAKRAAATRKTITQEIFLSLEYISFASR